MEGWRERQRQMLIERNKAMAKYTGMKDRIYSIWCGIKARCYTKTNIGYKNYGAKGVKMCDEWKNDYLAFRRWALANGYSDELTIDRIDPCGNYEPSNCRWADMSTQAKNKRWSIYLTLDGETKHLCEWAEELNIPLGTLYARHYKGWSDEEILLGRKNTREVEITVDGITHTLSEWAIITGQHRDKLYSRHRRGWDERSIVYGRENGSRNN